MTYNFDIEIATRIGVDEAIMLNNFVYWLLKNKANNKNFFDGNYWTFNSVRAYSELFPFWNETQIRRILKSLIDQNVLVVGNYNQNAYDRTNWYSLSSEYIHLIHWTISTNGKAENSQPIPNNKPVNKTINKSYYEFSFTLSKLIQYDNLSQEYKDKLKEEINKLNLSIAYDDFVDSLIAKGYKYKNFLAAYNNWCKKDFNKDKTNSNIDDKEWDYGITRCDPNEYR